MSKCLACEALVGATHGVPPHDKLFQTNREKHKSMGLHTAYKYTYKCTDCDTTWTCDHDKQDPHSGWSEAGASLS